MSDATDDLDYANSGLQDKFRRQDKELWQKQMKARTSPTDNQTPQPVDTTSNVWWGGDMSKTTVKLIYVCKSCGEPTNTKENIDALERLIAVRVAERMEELIIKARPNPNPEVMGDATVTQSIWYNAGLLEFETSLRAILAIQRKETLNNEQ